MRIKFLLIFVCFIVFSCCVFAHTTNIGSLKFTENKNQWPQQVLFSSKINFGELYLEKNTMTYVFYDPKIGKGIHHSDQYQPLANQLLNFQAVKINYVNANPLTEFTTENKLDAYSNYFLGNDPAKWASRVFSYNDVIQKNIYKGIDVHYYSVGSKLKYDYIVKAKQDPSQIIREFEGVDKIEIIENELLIHTSVGVVKEILPEVYQLINGKKQVVQCQYVLNGKKVSFNFPKGYNTNAELIIDPAIIFSSFTGSTADNWGFTATYDNLGNAYAGGIAFSAGYPLSVGAFQTFFAGGTPIPGAPGGFDMAISKYSSAGNTLVYSTYCGGSGNEQPHSLVVNSQNQLYIFGRSASANYPVTAGVYDVTHNGLFDMVVTKINEQGTALIASTFVGGSADDGVNFSSNELVRGELKYNYADDARGEIILDSIDNVYVAACTESADFPVTSGCFQPIKGNMQDGCVFKLDSNLVNLKSSSFLGGNSRDAAYALSLSKTADIIVVGGTQSANMVVTSGVLNPFFRSGIADGFIYRISNNASSILAASYIGTSSYDQVYFVQVDKDNDVYIYGQTEGAYPVTPGKYVNPGSGQFIHKMNIDFNTTIYSTVFGTSQGRPDISPTAFLVDRCENVYCAGWGGTLFGFNNSWSTTIGLPVSDDAFQATTNSDDLYFIILRKNADTLAYATYFGGLQSKEHVDGGTCRFDKNGIIYQAVCAGCGGVDDMPTTPGVVSNTNNSTNCNYGMIKYKFDLTETTADFGFTADTLGCTPFKVVFENTSTGYESLIWDFDDGTTSQDTSPTHIFHVPRAYNVKLITYNPNTCNERDTATKVIYVVAPFTVTALGEKQICKGDSVQLNATYVNAITYKWKPAGLVAPNDSVSIVKVSPSSTTTISVTINDGICSVTDVATITVNKNVTQIDAPDKVEICADSTLLLNAGKNFINYTWNTGSTNQYLLVDKPGVYKVITKDMNGCIGHDSVTVTQSGKVIIDVFPDTLVCKNEPVILRSIGATSYTWSPPLYLNDTIGDKVITKPDSNIIYYVTGKVKNCVGYDSVEVKILPDPKIELSDDVYARVGEEIKLTVKTDSLLQWYPSEKLSCITCFTNYFIADSTRMFYAETSNFLGCKAKDSVTVYVDYESSVYIPNCFSPNNDFSNDIYNVVTYGMVSYHMQIFNRWGQLVYEWNHTQNGWDGFYQGAPAKQDVYVFLFKGTDYKNKKIAIEGNITLIR